MTVKLATYEEVRELVEKSPGYTIEQMHKSGYALVFTHLIRLRNEGLIFFYEDKYYPNH